jgi:hypothetical protein
MNKTTCGRFLRDDDSRGAGPGYIVPVQGAYEDLSTAPAIFGLDGFEASAEEVVLKLVSRFSDSLQAYIYVSYILRVAADISSIEGREDLLPYFLRLQELVHP